MVTLTAGNQPTAAPRMLSTRAAPTPTQQAVTSGGTTVPLGPGVLNISGVRAGDRNQFNMRITSGGVPMDLTGQEVKAQARPTATATGAPSVEAVVTVTDPLDGSFTLGWPGDQVRTMLDGRNAWSGVWDLQVGPTGADAVTVVAGSFDAVMDVTR